MIYAVDLEIALARGTGSDTEDAFRALVGYPKEEEMERSAATPSMLRAVCRALDGSERIMPSGTIEVINDRTDAEGEDALLYGSSYGTGAARVLETTEEFAAFLDPTVADAAEQGGR